MIVEGRLVRIFAYNVLQNLDGVIVEALLQVDPTNRIGDLVYVRPPLPGALGKGESHIEIAALLRNQVSQIVQCDRVFRLQPDGVFIELLRFGWTSHMEQCAY